MAEIVLPLKYDALPQKCGYNQTKEAKPLGLAKY
jgi:hypothetical protein